VGDIDLQNKRLILRITKVKAKKGEKNPKPRIIPISSQFVKTLTKIIEKYKLNADSYFPILSTPAANIGMKKALVLAGIKDPHNFSVHNVRKTTEVWLMCLGVDSMPIIAHIGHDLKTAMQNYISPDALSYDEKRMIRDVLGDIYQKQF
jgi:integrase